MTGLLKPHHADTGFSVIVHRIYPHLLKRCRLHSRLAPERGTCVSGHDLATNQDDIPGFHGDFGLEFHQQRRTQCVPLLRSALAQKLKRLTNVAGEIQVYGPTVAVKCACSPGGARIVAHTNFTARPRYPTTPPSQTPRLSPTPRSRIPRSAPHWRSRLSTRRRTRRSRASAPFGRARTR